MVSNTKLLDFGYVSRQTQRVVAQSGNMSIEDMLAQMSYDHGVADQQVWTIPNPTVMRHLNAAGAYTEPTREAELDLLDQIDDMTQAIPILMQAWAPMSSVVPALKVVQTGGVRVYERATETLQEEGMIGMAFISQANVAAATAYYEKIELALHVLSRFFPGGTLQPAEWHHPSRPAPSVQADDVHCQRPMNLMSAMLARMAVKMTDEGYKEQLTSKEARIIAAQELWVQYVGIVADDNGTQVGENWIKMLLEILLDLKPILDYTIVLQRTQGYSTRDMDVLRANLQAVEMIEPLFCQNHVWTPLANRYRVESNRDYFALSFDPVYYRNSYNPQIATANLRGFDANIMAPDLEQVGQLVHHHPDFADDLTRTFYRTTRSTDVLVGTRDCVIDVFAQDLGSEHVEAYEGMMTYITDAMTSRSFTPHDGDSVMQAASDIFQPFLDDMGVGHIVPLSGKTLKNAGTIEAAGLIPGYSIEIKENEDTVKSSSVAIPWTQEFREDLSYGLQAVPYAVPSPWTAR